MLAEDHVPKMRKTLLSLFLLSSLQCFAAKEQLPNVIPLAEYLEKEICGLYFLSTGSEHDLYIVSSMQRPIHIVNLIGLNGLRSLRFGCSALVYEDIVGFPWSKLKIAGIFQRIYMLSRDDNGPGYKEVTFGATAFEYCVRRNGEITIDILCPSSEHAVNLWKPGLGFTSKLGDAKQQCSSVLQGKHLKVAATTLSPYIIHSSSGVRGVEKTIMDIIAKKMLFTYNISSIDDESGAKINGSWSGVMKRVVSGEADIGIGGLLLLRDRNRDVDFSTPPYPENMHLMATKPRIVSSHMNFLNPFNSQVWWIILAVFALTTISFTGMVHVKVRREERNQDLWRSLFVCLKIMLHNAGVAFQHRNHGSWILFGFCCVFAFFISAMYTCNFRAFLMQTKYERTVDTEDDIVNLKKKLFVPTNSVVSKLFSTSPLSIQRKIFKQSNDKEHYFHWQNGKIPKYVMDKMILEGGVTASVKELLYNSFPYFNKTYGYIPFKMGSKEIFQFYSGFIVQKKTSWRPDMDKVILRLVAAGIILHLKDNAVPYRFLSDDPQDTSPKPFGVEQTLGIFYILGGGLVTSIIGFVLEIILRPVHHVHDGVTAGHKLQITVQM